MSYTAKKIADEKKSLASVLKEREKLVSEGLYPQKFSKPISLQLELTSRCNLRCKHCYNRSGEKNIDRMTGAKWVQFCKTLVDGGGILQATISGGEPLLLGTELWKIMDILHEDGTVFNLISNGLIFDDTAIKAIQKYRFYWLQISIDSYVAEHHDNFRGVRGSWRKAAEAAYKIALSGIPVRIATTITKVDLDHIEKLIQMAINLGASYYIIGEVMPSGRAYDNPDLFLSGEERDQFYKETDHLKKKYRNEIDILSSGSERVQLEYAASGVIDGAIIRPDGNVRLDCTCPFTIGNVLDEDFFDIWTRSAHAWQDAKVLEYIRGCDSFTGMNLHIENYNQQDIVV